MTTETRTLIELSDIVNVEMECPACGVAVSIPLTKVATTITAVCQCGGRFFDERPNRHPSQGQYPAIDSLIAIAANLVALTNGERTDLHAKVKLRVKSEAAK
jgi:hypothetical protein